MNFDSSVLQVPIEDIIPNRFQPRLSFDDDALNELALSIKEHGIIQPLVLRRNGDKYEIIAGERRYKAATMAGLASVPAVISQIDDAKSAEIAVVENVQRRNLSAIEEAKSYKLLLDQGLMNQEQLARKMGLSQSAISNKLRLLNLSEEVQNAVMENKISERHARSLLSLNNHEKQNEYLNKIINERLTVRALDELLKKDGAINLTDTKIMDQKLYSQDISITPSPTVQSQNIETQFVNEPINLGEKPKDKFFNVLEDEEVNMNMNEEKSVLSEPVYIDTMSNQTPLEEVLQIDSLDFMPAVNQTIDFSKAINNINEVVNNLKTEYEVIVNQNEINNELSFTITVKQKN